MQENHLFEYAIIRVVPKVEREEFINTGVVLFCAKQKFLSARFMLNEARIRALSEDLDIAEIRLHLNAFEQICRGDSAGGPIAKLDIASRFRWLTATRSTVLQSSKVHPGFCGEPEKALEKLYEQFVV